MTDHERMQALDRKVTKANELIQQSRYSLTLQQQKIVLYLISKVSPYDTDFHEYEFSISEFCQVCGIDYKNGKNYIDLKQAIKDIADKSMWVTLVDGDTETLVRWIDKPYITAKNGTIRIRLDEDMKPYLLQLKDNFTSYELIWTLNFKSKYTIRLYEIIKSIHFHDLETYERIYGLDELRQMLDATTYKTWQHFNDKVLKVATREINENSDKTVVYEPIKKGNKIVKVKFTIGSKDALEVLELRAKVERDLGFEQLSLFD